MRIHRLYVYLMRTLTARISYAYSNCTYIVCVLWLHVCLMRTMPARISYAYTNFRYILYIHCLFLYLLRSLTALISYAYLTEYILCIHSLQVYLMHTLTAGISYAYTKCAYLMRTLTGRISDMRTLSVQTNCCQCLSCADDCTPASCWLSRLQCQSSAVVLHVPCGVCLYHYIGVTVPVSILIVTHAASTLALWAYAVRKALTLHSNAFAHTRFLCVYCLCTWVVTVPSLVKIWMSLALNE